MSVQKEYTLQEREQALEDFDTFLFQMDDVLEPFVDQALADGYVLNYSLESLDKLEAFTLAQKAQPLSDFHGQASQYLGEVVRKTYGGKWALSLDMAGNSLNYGKPVIEGHADPDVQFAPYQIMRNFMRRPKAGLLRKAIQSQTAPEILDLSHLPTEKPLEGSSD